MNFSHSSLRAGNAGIACARRDSVLVAEDATGGHARLVLAHVRQQRPAVDVADGIGPFVAGHAQPVVDVDRAPRLQADRLQAELGGVRPAPDRDEQPIAGDDAAIFKFDTDLAVLGCP